MGFPVLKAYVKITDTKILIENYNKIIIENINRNPLER